MLSADKADRKMGIKRLLGASESFWCHQNIWKWYDCIGLNNIYSDKVHDIHKYNVKIIGSDSKPVAYLDHLLDML